MNHLAEYRYTFSRYQEHHPRIVILGAGPSIRGFSLHNLKSRPFFVIAVNRLATFYPLADAWITVDTSALDRNLPPPRFQGLRFIAVPPDAGKPTTAHPAINYKPPRPGYHYLRCYETTRLRRRPGEVITFNSALAALNLAYHCKPEKIALLGVDLTDVGRYFYGPRQGSTRQNRQLIASAALFDGVAPDIQEAGIQVINGSPISTITAWPKTTPAEAIRWLENIS